MTILRNDQIKAAMVAKLKANTTIVALLKDAAEIREAQWKGTEFSYPNIRVRVMPDGNKPTAANCNFSSIRVGIAVFSEGDNSKEADQIAGIIANELHTQSFSSTGIAFTNLKVEMLVPAIGDDERLWISEVILNGTATSG